MTMDTPRRSKHFFYWFIGILIIPLAGSLFLPTVDALWFLILLANTAVFLFNLGVFTGRGQDPGRAQVRWLLFTSAALFAALLVIWGIRVGATIARTGSLNL